MPGPPVGPRSGSRPRRPRRPRLREDAVDRVLLRLEDPGRAGEGQVLRRDAGGLDHAAVGGEVAEAGWPGRRRRCTRAPRSRMQPSAASVSRVDQRLSVENGSVVRTPPGAAWNSSSASSVAVPPRMSQSASHSSRSGECTAWHVAVQQAGPVQLAQDRRDAAGPVHVLHVVLRACSARPWTGTAPGGRSRRCRRRVKSTSASRAAASRCSTVLVEPPMATSSATAFSNAARVAIARGSTDASSPS